MPIPMIDTSINNKTFGPWIRKGMEKGLEKGMEKGLEKGLVKGAQRALHLALKQRFGALPSAIDRQVRKLTAGQAEETSGWRAGPQEPGRTVPGSGEDALAARCGFRHGYGLYSQLR